MELIGLKHLNVDPTEVARYISPWLDKGMQIRTCATDLRQKGIPAGACCDIEWITGMSFPESTLPVAKRMGCLCFYPKGVTLIKIPRCSNCSGRCVACYAQEHV